MPKPPRGSESRSLTDEANPDRFRFFGDSDHDYSVRE